VAILLGLFLERRSIGQGLAAFVNQLALRPTADPEALMRASFNDPSLQIAYYARGFGAHVDASGGRVELPHDDPGREITRVQNLKAPVAAIVYDATLADQATFIEAAAAAVLMRLQREQLEADLKASTKALASSRQRLVDASNAERQRIERDLHDGVQQQLVALRLKLEMASEVISEEPVRGQRMLATLGGQMDELLATLRSMARGIYPSLLAHHGLADALTSEARRVPLPVSVKTRGLGRYPEEVEVAVYFCCLEALQNAGKHAGPKAKVAVRLWGEADRLWFQVHDTGVGFDPGNVERRHGLFNMRDRIEAVGGALTITSREALGTTVRGTVPVASPSPRLG
jgi:signal transduction histidine kinase